jgi:hypothetical protein
MAEQIHHHLNLIQPQSTIFKKYQLLVEQVLTGVLKFDETACDTLFWEDMV